MLKLTSLALAFLCIFMSAPPALAKPKNVIIIRHGEKFLPEGCLSLQGLQRSSALGHYFSGDVKYNNPPISHVFAAYNIKPKPYIRAKQTCSLIAEHLNLPLNTAYGVGDVRKIARLILTDSAYDNRTVLLCWEHEHIAPLVVALRGNDPGQWDKDVYDQVYMLTYEGATSPKFQQFLQTLLYGDRENYSDKPTPLAPIPAPCPKDKV